MTSIGSPTDQLDQDNLNVGLFEQPTNEEPVNIQTSSGGRSHGFSSAGINFYGKQEVWRPEEDDDQNDENEPVFSQYSQKPEQLETIYEEPEREDPSKYGA